MRLYLDEVGRYPLLTKDDEARLGQLVQAGQEAKVTLDSQSTIPAAQRRALARAVRAGEKAAENFVKANLRLVVSIASKYQWSGLPLLDLVQEGNLGLIHAVEKFDWRKGFKFSTYATWWIRQAIGRAIDNTGRTIRLPGHVGDQIRKIKRSQSTMVDGPSAARRPTPSWRRRPGSPRVHGRICCVTTTSRPAWPAGSARATTPNSAT